MSNRAAVKQDAKPTLTPKLRFPEFRDGPGWEETKLKDVLTEHRLKSDGKCEVHSVSVHKGVINQIEHLGRSFAAADTLNYNLAKPYDVIYTKSPTGDFPFGVVKHNHKPHNVIVSPLYGVFSPANRHLGYIFDAYFESPIRTTNYLAPLTQKGAKNTLQISNERFLSSGIYLPHEEGEQQNIAECLSSVDELIAAQARKLDTLKTHKKGLMQQLFPRDGETQPRLRFPEFRDAGKWEEEKLGNIVKIWSGNSPSKYALSALGKYAFVKVEDLNNCTKYQTDSREYCDDSDDAVPRCAILFPKRGASIELNKLRITASEILIDTNLMALSPNGTATVEFLYYFLVNVGLAQIADMSTIPQINNKHIIPFKILFPSKLEQESIADCLTFLDDLISAQSDKLEALKTHKKGLMQQLFQSPEKVEA